MNSLGFIIPFMAEQSAIEYKNQEKVQECIDKWMNAKDLPRKLKKKVRKQANKDYAFWKSIGEYHKSLFSF